MKTKHNMVVQVLLGGVLALLAGASSAQTLSASRSSSFEYNATTGLLTAEIVEPGNPQLCVRTEYVYDAYGNKQASTVKNCAGATGDALFATRSATGRFDAQTVTVSGTTYQVRQGQFTTTITNAKNQSETKQFDPRFGAVVSHTGPNNLTTQFQYDDFGRKVLEIAADGNRVATRYCVLPGKGDTSANSVGCGTPFPSPSLAVSYVEVQPQDSAGAVSGPYARKYADALGRTIREETQGYDGAEQPDNARKIIKDTEYNTYGAVAKITQPYFVENGSSLPAGGGSPVYGEDGLVLYHEGRIHPGWTRMEYDALGRPISVSSRDDEGKGGGFSSRVAYSTMSYNGLVVTHTSYRTSKNAQGQQQAETLLTVTKTADPLGQLVEVRDALNGSLRKRYDPFGNVIETQDALDNRIRTTFDTRGRKTQMADPNAGTWNYRYDALGQLIGQQSPIQSVWTTLSYDVLGRMLQRAEPEYTTDWTYDTCGPGRLCRVATTNGQSKDFGYDNFGRPITVTQTAGSAMTATTAYDSKGRVSQYTYPSGLAVQYQYTALGYLREIAGMGAASLWKLTSTNAWGKAESYHFAGNAAGHGTRMTYDGVTGRVTSIAAGDADAIMRQTYGWDTVGNLTDRSERYQSGGSLGTLNENFGYDMLNRLWSYETSSPDLTGLSKLVGITYDPIGNIKSKSDVGNYVYPASGSASVRPGAVQRITEASRSYTYDAAGNLTSASGGRYSTLTYTSFNLPLTLSGSGASYSWIYGAEHERVRETRSNGGGTRVTTYFHPNNAGGLAFEQEVTNGGTPVNRHYVSVMGRTIALVKTVGALGTSQAQTVTEYQYWHVDQLGSVVAITDQNAGVKNRFSYDPFGKRRFTDGDYDPNGSLIVDTNAAHTTDRGFTGHEHLDDVGIVHMNGRTFDPLIGRFMQADPLIQDPDELQNYDRYSYVLNNPLNATDPTGHWSWKGFLGGAVKFSAMSHINVRSHFEWIRVQPGQEQVDRFIMKNPIAYQIGLIAASYFGGPAGAAAWSSYYSYRSTGSMSAAFRAGAESYAMSMAFSYVGGEFNADLAAAQGMSPEAVASIRMMNYAGHAAIGCVAGAMHGGGGEGCVRGAASSFAAKWATVNSPTSWGNAGQFAATVIAGGTVSVIGGGKFENGAVTAAFGYIFNHLASSGRQLARLAGKGAQILTDYLIDAGAEKIHDNLHLRAGGVHAIADGVFKFGDVDFFHAAEVKLGEGDYTKNQRIVYRAMHAGQDIEMWGSGADKIAARLGLTANDAGVYKVPAGRLRIEAFSFTRDGQFNSSRSQILNDALRKGISGRGSFD